MKRAARLSAASFGARLLAGCLVAACDEVPSLTFAEFDAGDAGHDAAIQAPDEAGADVAIGCPGPHPPAGASVCCGPVPCNGDCAAHCADCESTCTVAGTFCCAKNNNVLCRAEGAPCN